jgi:inosose dehydratase
MSDLKFGYAINQWDPARREQQERAFKVMSACGFRAVELTAGSGRWAPLGNPHQIVDVNFGSAAKFREFLRSCGVDRVASWFYDPGQRSTEEDSPGRSPSNAADHEGIVESLRPFARLTQELGGSCLVVRPMASYWREAPVTEDKLKRAADCWNKVGKMAGKFGIQVALHPDFLCAIHSAGDIARILELTDPDGGAGDRHRRDDHRRQRSGGAI